jgi:O-antigen/teichoic acid export membrane protein
MTVSAFTLLLDFGFGPSFTRNITYIFSGVKKLRTTGHETVDERDNKIDYSLLKGTINAMKWFYLRMSGLLLLLLITIGTYYISVIVRNYEGDTREVYIAWGILCLINTYNLYTFYYESLLQGRGLIKRSKQIIISGQLVYLCTATILILAGHGLIAIVSSQLLAVLTTRSLSYLSFFDRNTNKVLKSANARGRKEVLEAIYPNALKIGLASLGGFMIQRSALIIGSLFLPLKDIAEYGISMQLVTVIAGISGIYISTFQPKIAEYRIRSKVSAIRKLFLKGTAILLLTYFVCGGALVLLGDLALELIGSQTALLPESLLILALVTSLIENNKMMAGNIILTKNEVPFFKASLISGGVIILLLYSVMNFFKGGLLALIIIPLIVDLAYQAWKWPLVVFRDLQVSVSTRRKGKTSGPG